MRLFGRLLTAFMIVVAFVVGCALFAPSTAHAEVWNHKAYSSLAKNSPSKAKYVQGTCYDGTRYAYTDNKTAPSTRCCGAPTCARAAKPRR